MIIQLLRYLLGYINFKAKGGFADRFINLCAKEGIPLWNVQNIKNNITGSTTIEGYLALHHIAKKSGMRVAHTDKVGLKYFFRNHKARVGVLIGLGVVVALLSVLSQLVWSVSVVGNSNIEGDDLLSSLEGYGVKIGAISSKIDNDEVASQLLSEYESLSWASVNMKGSVVVVEVREKTPAPEIYDDTIPTNVVAGEDGVLISVDVLHGVEEVKPGSAVTKGDLLISGIIPYSDGSERLVHADGYVKALVIKNKVISQEDFSLFFIENEKIRNSIFFFGIRIPLGKQTFNHIKTEHKSFLSSSENLLPVGIITEYGAVLSKEPTVVNTDLQGKISLYRSGVYIRDLLDICQVNNVEITKHTHKNNVEFKLCAKCEQEIGVLQEIYVEKTNDIQ